MNNFRKICPPNILVIKKCFISTSEGAQVPKRLVRPTIEKLKRMSKLDAKDTRWAACVRGVHPHGAFPAGTTSDGGILYVIRAHYKLGLYPGTLNDKTKIASVPCAGKELVKDIYEVLVAHPATLKWTKFCPETEFKNAVEGGTSIDRETLYVGRAQVDDEMLVGRVHPGHEACYVAHHGEEIACQDYEILVYNTHKFVVQRHANYL